MSAFIPRATVRAVNLSHRTMSTLSSTGIRWDRTGIAPELNEMLDNKEFIELLAEGQTRFAPVYNDIREQRNELWEDIKVNGLKHRDDTAYIRESDWTAAAIPEVLQQRPVELTGPAYDAAMLIGALNTGKLAKNLSVASDPKNPLFKYMPDAEDAGNPRLDVELLSVYNLREALAGRLKVEKTAADGSIKTYQLNDHIAYPIMRMPGLHFDEASMLDAGHRAIPNHLLVSALYMYYIAPEMTARGWPPSVYQPKLQTYEDAVLVNDVFNYLERELGLEQGVTKMTCLIETHPILAQLDELIYALRSRIVGVNDGRWDKIAHDIECNPHGEYPDPSKITMNTSHMEAYTQLTSYHCDKRGILSMGGMSADIKTAATADEIDARIKDDKEQELRRGKAGAWVAQPSLVELVGKIFAEPTDIKKDPIRKVDLAEITTFPSSLAGPEHRTEAGLRTAISVSLQYIAAWISGRGAVALKGKMEDMATAEINYKVMWTWLQHERDMTFSDGSVKPLNQDRFNRIFRDVALEVSQSNEIPFAVDQLPAAERALKTLVTSEHMHRFIADVAYPMLNYNVKKPTPINRDFATIQFAPEAFDYLKPSHRVDGAALVKKRGAYFQEYLNTRRDDSLPPHFKWLGVTSGLAAASTLAGGAQYSKSAKKVLGHVGAYAGGWQANAMRNQFNQCLPDTLNIGPDDAAAAGEEFNNFYRSIMSVRHLSYMEQREALAVMPADQRDLAMQILESKQLDFFEVPALIDLEQGWCNEQLIKQGVDRAIDRGFNVIHIEDQGPFKRCGHLGDKELAVFDDWALVLRAANLQAQIRLGAKEQTQWNFMTFVARTDALSAKRIVKSDLQLDPDHIDHPFIDFDRGTTPDGKYYYLKQGINPETGNPYGLDLSIVRCAKVVELGLASHVWMETPDAKVSTAKTFLEGVNKILAPMGKRAQGHYNNSPSFDWDVGFYPPAREMAQTFLSHMQTEIYPELKAYYDRNGVLGRDRLFIAEQQIHDFFKNHADPVGSDYSITGKNVTWLLHNGMDYCMGESAWRDQLHQVRGHMQNQLPGLQAFKAIEESMRVEGLTYRPEHHAANIIVAQRLRNFQPSLAAIGFNSQLCTLPQWHQEAFRSHVLAESYAERGMEGYVEHVQRPERKYADVHAGSANPYEWYGHQSTTLGDSVLFAKHTGSLNVNVLAESTEADDLKKRESLSLKDDPGHKRDSVLGAAEALSL